jgi:Ig-like domain-containing protein
MKMANSKTKYLIWFTALVLIMACVPTLAAPPVSTTDPHAISTYIAQTANVAASQTAAAMPTFTPTVTFTPTLRNTDTPEPTATSTVIFHFYTPTSIVPTLSSSSGGGSTGPATSNKSYACEIITITPANGTTFASRTDFDATWKVKNNGKSDWDKNSVDYIYLSGDKFHKVAAYDLGKTITPGQTISLAVAMQAPKNAGTYTTTWTLRVGSDTFCKMNLTITVQ